MTRPFAGIMFSFVWMSSSSTLAGPGDCCVSHGYGGCGDATCTQTVCDMDSVCCIFFWDQACADQARQFCDVCAICGDGIIGVGEQCDPPSGFSCDANCQLGVCATSMETCCGGHPSPGCANAGCCESVCTCDPFCCEVAWDSACALNGVGALGCGARALCSSCAVCGDGIVGVGEQCEPPNSSTCDATCQDVVCGDGVVEGAEECDPPNGTTCNANCQNIACGDGVVEGVEECDPPNGTSCNANCQSIVCGDFVVEGNEDCDPPFFQLCSDTCRFLYCEEMEADGNCQSASATGSAWAARECDDIFGIVQSYDDFVADVSGDLTSLCWSGRWLYWGGGECDPRFSNFIVRVYSDDNGLPGALVGQRSASDVTATVLFFGPSPRYQYHAELTPGIPLTQNTKYWLSITDASDCPGGADPCRHWWVSAEASEGNNAGVISLGSPPCFEALESSPGVVDDLAWCLDIANSVPPAVSTLRACCTGAMCQMAEPCDCELDLGGVSMLDELQCSTSPCGPGCGDGVVDGEEQCDPPDGATCSGSCQFMCGVFGTDFDSGVPMSFSGVTTVDGVQNFGGLGTGGNVFGGNFLRNSTGSTYSGGPAPSPSVLTLTNLPPHTGVSLRFLLAIINSWDGTGCIGPNRGPDLFNVRVDGSLVFSHVFENSGCGIQSYIPPPGVLLARKSPLGFGNGGEQSDSAYNMGLDPSFSDIPHSSDSLTVEWFASGAGWQGGSDESWAIDNVEVLLHGQSQCHCGDGANSLVGWGDDFYGQVSGIPAGSFTAMATSEGHGLAIRSDGTLAGWGWNDEGQTNVPSGTFAAVAAGYAHSLAIRSDGTLVGWGSNSLGQTNVPTGTFLAVAAGSSHSLAIRSDGTLVGWGSNSHGQINVPPGTFIAVSAGGGYSLAIRTDGTLAGWGLNDVGQTFVPSGTFAAVGAGFAHALAIRGDGTLEGWGDNSWGQVLVPSGTFTSVSAGLNYSLALRTDGTLEAWGDNSFAQLDVPPGTFTAIAAGYVHGLALTPCGNGIVACGEECDDGAANSDTAPDACRTNCVLPSCGDNVVDTGEQCDPPNGSSCDANCQMLISAVQPEPGGANKNRYISFVVPSNGAGINTAIRVRLTSLHHPAGPPNAPNFTAFEGQYRYLNAIRDGANNPVFVCPDSVASGTSYKCAKLGCAPEYRDWAGIFGGAAVHVTGDSVVPSSQYEVAQLAYSCAGNETSCTAASAVLTISTERWGNVDNTPPGGTPNAIDISKVVDKVKDVPGAFIEPRCQLREAIPNPYGLAVNAQDIGRIVDAVKGYAYPFTIAACP